MRKIFSIVLSMLCLYVVGQRTLFMPQNIKKAYANGTRSADGKPGKSYWQNHGTYTINISVNPPSKRVEGNETISYRNNSPKELTSIVVKLILNIHKPGAARQGVAGPDYLTDGIVIDQYMENGKERKFTSAGGRTFEEIALGTALAPNDSIQLRFKWHYDLSEESGREGKLDSTSFFLAYFYPRVAVMDDVFGWDRMEFTDAQEFYNDFNDYKVSVTVPKNYIVWGTGTLQNTEAVLQQTYSDRLNKSFTSDAVIKIADKADLASKAVTVQNNFNTWIWTAANISDMAYCISDHYLWDAASVVIDKTTGRRASCQSAYLDDAKNFHNQVDHIRHSLDWYSNNFPGVPYPFPKSTIIEGFADMEYPMMANDSRQDDDVIQRFIAEHEVGHTYFPFYMGINEHRYGFMDEGWTTAFEYMIGTADLGKAKASTFFKQFRIASWALNPSDESQIPVITPVNVLSGRGMGDNEYGKPALAYLGLKDMLGDVLFKKSLHGFMENWHGKHPIPWDMFNSFSSYSAKNLDWYFSNWFMTSSYIDLKLGTIIPSSTGFKTTVTNLGGYVIPFDLLAEYTDGSRDTLHQTAAVWEKNSQAANLSVSTKKKVKWVRVDTGIYMDANDQDNSWGINPPAAAMKVDLSKDLGESASAQIPFNFIITQNGDNMEAVATGQEATTLTNSAKDTYEFTQAGIVLMFDPAAGKMGLKQGVAEYNFAKDKK